MNIVVNCPRILLRINPASVQNAVIVSGQTGHVDLDFSFAHILPSNGLGVAHATLPIGEIGVCKRNRKIGGGRSPQGRASGDRLLFVKCAEGLAPKTKLLRLIPIANHSHIQSMREFIKRTADRIENRLEQHPLKTVFCGAVALAVFYSNFQIDEKGTTPVDVIGEGATELFATLDAD